MLPWDEISLPGTNNVEIHPVAANSILNLCMLNFIYFPKLIEYLDWPKDPMSSFFPLHLMLRVETITQFQFWAAPVSAPRDPLLG